MANGDVVVLAGPTGPGRDFLKRVIAGPGQTVQIEPNGEVRVDGETLDEPYIQGTTNCFDNTRCQQMQHHQSPKLDASPIAVETGGDQPECKTTACYFVMGDNRPNSSDSRQGWLVPVENIIGYIDVDR